MATYSEILRRLLSNIDSVPDAYSASIKKIQDDVFREILPLLEKLELDENKAVIANSKNYGITKEIEERLPKILERSGFSEAIKSFTNGLNEQKIITEALYDSIFDNVSYTSLNSMWSNSRNNAITVIGESAADYFSSVLTQTLNDSIGSSSTFSDIVKSIRQVSTGDSEIDGAMYRYAKQNAKDAFSVTNRKYAEQINRKMGVVFYRYSGANMDTTREFCLKRQGEYFHEKEIESWAKQSWQGKARNTNEDTIFVLCGGYNCNHFLSPVPVDKVPIDVVRKSVKKGWVKKEDLPVRVLGLL